MSNKSHKSLLSIGSLFGSIISQLKSLRKITSLGIIFTASKIELNSNFHWLFGMLGLYMPARANHDLFILTLNIMDSMQKLDRFILKCVITWKQMLFLIKIISPPLWISLLMQCIRKPSTLNWPLSEPASIFVSVMRSMSNLPDKWNLNPAILLACMCPILVLARFSFAYKSNELQVSNSESFSCRYTTSDNGSPQERASTWFFELIVYFVI